MDTPAPPPVAEAVNRDGLWAMPAGPPHAEDHAAPSALRRAVLAALVGGMVPPFAILAALMACGAPMPILLAAGFAAIAAGAVATGLGGYLAARSAAEHYQAERRREEAETIDYADRERWEVAAILHRYGVRGDALRLAVDSICADTRRWVDFMMRFELDLKEPEPRRATQAALASGVAATLGGLLPVAPFLLLAASPSAALALSGALTAAGLALAGALATRADGLPAWRGAVQAVAIGAAAALAATLLARMAAA
jgi:VIT1/CCC1 family predicted Fe2+/Mn2+ transporter